jgi:hypothetical protein
MTPLSTDNKAQSYGLPPRRLTRELLRAMELANMLATSRASTMVEVSDALVGMYLDNWERLSRFWAETDNVIKLFTQLCQISGPRWQKWMGDYDAMRAQFQQNKKLPASSPSKKNGDSDPYRLDISSELKQAFRAAEKIAPYSDRVEQVLIPIVSSECLLLCIVQNTTSALGRKLLATGLDVAALEKSVRFPKHAPI